MGVTILALGFAWYQQLKPVTADDCGCELTKVSFFQTKRFLSIVTVFAILMMAFPYYSGSLLGRNLPDKAMLENIETEDLIAYEFELEGMTCGGCEKYVTDTVYNLEGVLEVSTSYENGKTIVKFDDSKTTTEAIKNAITTTGYKVKGMKKINSKTASRNSNIE